MLIHLLFQQLVADQKQKMKTKKAELVQKIADMPDYALKVGGV